MPKPEILRRFARIQHADEDDDAVFALANMQARLHITPVDMYYSVHTHTHKNTLSNIWIFPARCKVATHKTRERMRTLPCWRAGSYARNVYVLFTHIAVL